MTRPTSIPSFGNDTGICSSFLKILVPSGVAIFVAVVGMESDLDPGLVVTGVSGRMQSDDLSAVDGAVNVTGVP